MALSDNQQLLFQEILAFSIAHAKSFSVHTKKIQDGLGLLLLGCKLKVDDDRSRVPVIIGSMRDYWTKCFANPLF